LPELNDSDVEEVISSLQNNEDNQGDQGNQDNRGKQDNQDIVTCKFNVDSLLNDPHSL